MQAPVNKPTDRIHHTKNMGKPAQDMTRVAREQSGQRSAPAGPSNTPFKGGGPQTPKVDYHY